jgi:hypothetical protein
MIGFLNRHPWIYLIIAFGLLIGAWTTIIVLANKHGPQEIEVKSH